MVYLKIKYTTQNVCMYAHFSHGKTGRDIFVTIPNCSVYKFRNVHKTQSTKHKQNVVDIKCVSIFLTILFKTVFATERIK